MGGASDEAPPAYRFPGRQKMAEKKKHHAPSPVADIRSLRYLKGIRRVEMGGASDEAPPAYRFPGRQKMAEKKKHHAPSPVADINVTPMVDVMLVLLIIFMVITPMLSKGKDVDLVKTKNPISMPAADKSDAVLIAVTRDGKS